MNGSERQRPTVRWQVFRRLRFILGLWLLRGLHYRLLIAGIIIMAVALVAGALAVVFDPNFSRLSEAVWWAFLRLSDPGYLGDDDGTARRIIATIVTVLGYVIFLGLLVAILIQWLNDIIARLTTGVTPVALSDHIIILGWTHCTPTIVFELLSTGARAKRFLERVGARQLRIVVLADSVDQSLRQELRLRLGDLWNDRQVLLRSGNSLRLEHLERVAFRSAAVIILPGADFAERNPDAVDAQSIKTLLSVSKHAQAAGCAPPLVVGGLFDGRRIDVARQAYAGDSEIFSVDNAVSRFIALSVRDNGIGDVLSEILTIHQGNTLFLKQIDNQAGMPYGRLQGAFPKAILLGIMRAGGNLPEFMPGPDSEIGADDFLILLARDFDDCVPSGQQREPVIPPTLPALPAMTARPRHILIVGWSRKVPTMIEEFATYWGAAFSVDIISSMPTAEREKIIQRRGVSGVHEHISHIEARYTVPGVLAGLDPTHYDSIVLLASEQLSDEEQADASTVLAYLALQQVLPEDGPRPKLFIELLDEDNRFLFGAEEEDIIVSPMIVSYVLSQVSLRRELAGVFRALAQSAGARIAMHPAEPYLNRSGSVRYDDLEQAAAARGDIALGLRRAGPRSELVLNPERSASWTLRPGDQVVVLAPSAVRKTFD